jgi:hypothetical protein
VHRGTPLGRFGRAEVFSLHATKSINALEGGMVTTNDDGVAERLRLLRDFGFVAEDTVVSLGINAKMNEFSAAMEPNLVDSTACARAFARPIGLGRPPESGCVSVPADVRSVTISWSKWTRPHRSGAMRCAVSWSPSA